jgi:hypothetical protein
MFKTRWDRCLKICNRVSGSLLKFFLFIVLFPLPVDPSTITSRVSFATIR